MAGNFGSDIAFWVDDDLSVSGQNANGALGDGYLRFVNVGRFFKLPTDALHRSGWPVRARLAVYAGAVDQYQSLRHLHPGEHRFRTVRT